MTSNLQVGNLCVTQNTNCAAVNNGLLVVVLAIDMTRTDGCHYRIRRVDGQAFPNIIRTDGSPLWFKDVECWATRHKLRRVDPDAKDKTAIREIEAQT